MSDILVLAGVVLAIAMPFLVAIFLKHYFAHKSKIASQLSLMKLEIAQLDNEDLRQQLDMTKSRVETIEAIVTDQGYELNRKISKL